MTGFEWLAKNEVRKINDYQFTLKRDRLRRLNLAELLDQFFIDIKRVSGTEIKPKGEPVPGIANLGRPETPQNSTTVPE